MIMKRFFLIMLFALTITGAAFAVQADSLFRQANEYYANADYEKAIDLYLKIDSLGYESSELYYNTGNAFFRSNKQGKARLYYERALNLNPSDEDINANLRYNESMLTDRFDEVPVLFFVRWYHSLLNLFSSDLWAYISLSFFILTLGGLFVYVFSGSGFWRRTGFYTGIISLFISLLSLVFAFRQSNEKDAAIVMSPSLTVKSAPRNSGKDLFVLHEGSKIWVLNELEGWKEIRISDGRKGWIPAGQIEKI